MAAAGGQTLIDMETLERAAPIIRHAAHPLRLRILDYLGAESAPRTVTEIVEASESAQSVVSQQLRILRDQGILRARRSGTYMLYELADRSVLLLLDCIRRRAGCCADHAAWNT